MPLSIKAAASFFGKAGAVGAGFAGCEPELEIEFGKSAKLMVEKRVCFKAASIWARSLNVNLFLFPKARRFFRLPINSSEVRGGAFLMSSAKFLKYSAIVSSYLALFGNAYHLVT